MTRSMKIDDTDVKMLRFLVDNPAWYTRREIAEQIGQRTLSNRRIDMLRYLQEAGLVFEWVGWVVDEHAAQYRVLYRGRRANDENGLSSVVQRGDKLDWRCNFILWKGQPMTPVKPDAE